jgi:asparagine N-glycosylation enzyme membrane subunit Stt3
MSKDGQYKIYDGVFLKVLFWVFLVISVLALIGTIVCMFINLLYLELLFMGVLFIGFILFMLLQVVMDNGGVDFLWE